MPRTPVKETHHCKNEMQETEVRPIKTKDPKVAMEVEGEEVNSNIVSCRFKTVVDVVTRLVCLHL